MNRLITQPSHVRPGTFLPALSINWNEKTERAEMQALGFWVDGWVTSMVVQYPRSGGLQLTKDRAAGDQAPASGCLYVSITNTSKHTASDLYYQGSSPVVTPGQLASLNRPHLLNILFLFLRHSRSSSDIQQSNTSQYYHFLCPATIYLAHPDRLFPSTLTISEHNLEYSIKHNTRSTTTQDDLPLRL